MDRRQFLRDAGSTLLVLPFGLFLVRCAGGDSTAYSATPTGTVSPTEPDPTPPDAAPRIEGDNIIYTSSVTNLHSHSVSIPTSSLTSPPTIALNETTSVVQAHTHSVTITPDDLRRAVNGETVKITSSAEVGHAHTFTVVKVG